MAKFKAEYENGVPTYTLTFRNKEFDYSMNQELEYGTGSNKPQFSKQLADTFDDLDEEDLNVEIDVDMLDCYLGDEDELFEIIDRLEELE